jgi:thiol-disulfide isomerase/thioredoxin
MRRVLPVVCAMLTVAAGCADASPSAGDEWAIPTNAVPSGAPLAVVELADLDGVLRSTAEFTGRPLVVNFWYASCEPCRREMPLLAGFHDERGDEVAVLGVNMGDPRTVAANFVANHGVRFPVLLDDEGELSAAMRIGLAPTTLFVAADGRVVDQVAGELTSDELAEAVSRIVVP